MAIGRILERAMGIQTKLMDVEQLADLIDRCFIQGADAKQLSDVRDTIKGSFFMVRTYNTDEYELRVSEYKMRHLPFNSRTVWVHEKETDIFYELEKMRWYTRLRKAVYAKLEAAGCGR